MNNGSIDNATHFTCGKMGQPSPLFCIEDEDKGSLGSVKLLTRKENKIKRIVTAQECKYCCHHEIGNYHQEWPLSRFETWDEG